MASFNKITLVGYLGRDPELKYSPQGTAICNFSMATTERRKDSRGEQQDQTTWFRVTLFNRLAEVANEYLKKGSLVYVEGRVRLNEYTDRDGQQRTALEVAANDLQFLTSRDRGGDQGGELSESQAAMDAQAPRRPLTRAKAEESVDERDIPF